MPRCKCPLHTGETEATLVVAIAIALLRWPAQTIVSRDVPKDPEQP
jgi:hypothetical protein